MSKKIKKNSKQLLESKTIRRFMELANLPKQRINEYVESELEESEELEEEIGTKRAIYEELPEDEDPVDGELEEPMPEEPMPEEPMPEEPVGDEEIVRNMVDAIADAIEQSTGVEINVSGQGEPEMGDEEIPVEDEMAPTSDEELPPEEEEPVLEESEDIEESAKEPWKGSSDQKWKKMSESQIISEVAKRVVEKLSCKKKNKK